MDDAILPLRQRSCGDAYAVRSADRGGVATVSALPYNKNVFQYSYLKKLKTVVEDNDDA